MKQNKDIEEMKKKVTNALRISDLKKTKDKNYPLIHKNKNCHPMTGFCFVATETMFQLLVDSGIHEYRPHCVRHEGDTHWFLMTKSGVVIDLTVGQFKTTPDYNRGRRNGMMRRRDPLNPSKTIPTKRTKKILRRIYGA